MKGSCFISYRYEDCKDGILKSFVENFKSICSDLIDVHYDQDEVEIGDSFDRFMKRINKVDVVLMFLTPGYKERVLNKKNGVWKEYQYIINRYEELKIKEKESETEKLTGFKIIPIIFKGNPEEIVINDIKDIRRLDLSYLRLDSNDKNIAAPIEKRFKIDLKNLKNTVFSVYTRKQKSYEGYLEKNYSNIFLSSLFSDTKSDFLNPKYSNLKPEKTVFVKTFTYQQLETQASYYVVGRKGSGKSANGQVLQIRNKDKYNLTIDVSPEELNFPLIYNLEDYEFEADVQYLEIRERTLRFTWKYFLILKIIDIAISNLPLYTDNNKAFQNLIDLKIKLSQTEQLATNIKSLFVYAFINVQNYLNKCINDSRNEERFLIFDIVKKIEFNQFIETELGFDILNELENITTILDKRILFVFDGFDTTFDDFRLMRGISNDIDVDLLNDKSEFEHLWLRSLLWLINDIKQTQNGIKEIRCELDFAVAIPLDRFLEVLTYDRDSYRYTSRYSILIWSGLELALCIRKRLEVVYNYRSKEEKLIDSVSETHKEILKSVPYDFKVSFNSIIYNTNLFFYILRHTFWRPRDVLVYYNHIITLAESLKEHGEDLSIDALRICISDVTQAIIKSEFINENRAVLLNIESIIEEFDNMNQILSFDELESIINPIKFEFSLPSKDIQPNIQFKIKILYQLGFLGLYNKKEKNHLRNKYRAKTDTLFVFSEGAKILNGLKEDDSKRIDYIIHPIFCEFLNLDTSNNSDFVMNYDWEYLKSVETSMRANNHQYIVTF